MCLRNEMKRCAFREMRKTREMNALRALWKYYDNAKLCFAIHDGVAVNS